MSRVAAAHVMILAKPGMHGDRLYLNITCTDTHTPDFNASRFEAVIEISAWDRFPK